MGKWWEAVGAIVFFAFLISAIALMFYFWWMFLAESFAGRGW